MTKICTKCSIEKDLSEFSKRSDAKDGYRNDCKECHRKRWKQYYQENKEEIGVKNKKYTEQHQEELLEYRKQYYQENKEEISIQNKSYRDDHKEEINEYHRQYYQENKEYVIARTMKYKKNKRETDICFRLMNNVSCVVTSYLKKGGISKNGKSIKNFLPFDDKQLRDHLEKQFDENMTWENYGSYWWIDHIIPQSSLIFDSFEHPNFLKCWSLDNLRPLEKHENMKKGNKIIDINNQQLLGE